MTVGNSKQTARSSAPGEVHSLDQQRDQQRRRQPDQGQKIYDIVGVGFGPANLALAIALEEMGYQGSVRFVEKCASTAWHPGLMLSGSDIQNHPVRALVSLRNPRSRYSFINYLHEANRPLEFLNLPLHFPLRKDYARYVAWVAEHFRHLVDFQRPVTALDLYEQDGQPLWRTETAGGEVYWSRSLVVGTGRTPRVPELYQSHIGPRVFHATQYLPRLAALNSAESAPRRIGVLGASQTAVELMLDLADRFPDSEIVCICRSYGFRLKDTSPFSERAFLPEFVDYYYEVGHRAQNALNDQLSPTNYSSADQDVIEKLYAKMYEERIDGRDRIKLINNTDVRAIATTDSDVSLELEEVHLGTRSELDLDVLIMATGFRNFGTEAGAEPYPRLLESFVSQLKFHPEGYIHLARDYALEPSTGRSKHLPPIYLNGLCERSHGLGDAGSFSLLSLRSDTIAKSLISRLEALSQPIARGIRVCRNADGPWRPYLGRQFKDVITAHPQTDNGAGTQQPGIIQAPFGMALSRMAPGESTVRHAHEVAEAFVIVSGHPVVEVDGERISLNPSDVVYVEPHRSHTLHNADDGEEVQFACFWWQAAATNDPAADKAQTQVAAAKSQAL